MPKPVAVVMKAQPSHHKKRGYVLLVLVVLVCLAVAGWLMYHNRHDDSDTGKKVTAAEKHTEVMKQVATADNAGDFAAEAKQLQAYIDSNPPSEYAESEIIRLATAYQNTKDYDNAIKWYQVALDKYPDAKLAATRGIAYAYMAKGDKQKAIEYFEKTIEIEKSDPSTVYLVQNEENNIRYIKGQIQ